MIELSKFESSLDFTEVEKAFYLARIDGSIRTVNFWEHRTHKDVTKQLEYIIPVLEEYFPENWDIGWKVLNNTFRPTLIVYFPEIEIENENNKKHLIKGLGMVLRFNINSNKLQPEIQGFRTHKSLVETYVGYQHSHLPVISNTTNPMTHLENFCLGDSDIYELFSLLNDIDLEEDTKEYYITIFEQICLMLKVHASTESLAGGPYIKIKNLGNMSDIEFSFRTIDREYHEMIAYITTHKNILNIDYVNTFEGFKIRDNQKFENVIRQLLQENNRLNKVLVSERNNREYLSSEETSLIIKKEMEKVASQNENTFTYIHGKKIPLIIDLEIETKENNCKISKNFLNYVRTSLEETINKRYSSNRIKEKLNQALLEEVGLRENRILM